MGVTQYTGARYVPLFADPADWTDERTYEPLTIVLHEGNSFTSKQFVPKGVELDNEDYWAETGNYNAQVEQYRREVIGYSEVVDDYKASTDADIAQYKEDMQRQYDAMVGTFDERISFSENKIKGFAKFEFGADDDCVWHLITLPRDKVNFNVGINPSSQNVEQAAPIADFAIRENAVVVSNVTSTGADPNEDYRFLWDGIIHGNVQPISQNSGVIAFRNLDDDFDFISGTIERPSMADLYNRGYRYAIGAWQGLIVDGNVQPIGTSASFDIKNPRNNLAWDDENWYLYTVYGRFETKFGYTMKQVQDFGLARGWRNLWALDGGGSVQVFAGSPARGLSPVIENNNSYRNNTFNINFTVKE